MKYLECLEWLYSLENMGIKLGLDRMRHLMHVLGDPQDSYRSVHVAGTNGKGSVSAMLSSIYREAGLRTGLYTSPHLEDFRERIQVNGEMITPEEVVALTIEIQEALATPDMPSGRDPTFFEITTAMAFLYFKRRGVEMAVIEVGLGGRLDATNIIRPDCTIITRIGMEHTQYLGDTMAKIAYEKAGIIKEGIAVITAETDEAALRTIDAVARDKGSPLLLAGRDFEFVTSSKGLGGTDVHLHSINRDVRLPLLGSYQSANAALACECALETARMGRPVDEMSIVSGLSKVSWPGRLELVSREPMVFFDVTHTTQGAEAIVKDLADLMPRRMVLVIGVLNDKDLDGIVRTLAPLADKAIATEPKTKRAFAAEDVTRALRSHLPYVTMERDVAKALDRAVSIVRPGQAILVTGSLYMIGEARQWLRQRDMK